MTTATIESLMNKDVFCAYSHLAENYYYGIIYYRRNAFQPLCKDSLPQTRIILIVFVVYFKQHMSQTFTSSAKFPFFG